MRISFSILPLLVLSLASCGSDDTPTDTSTYANALDAMDAATVAQANKEYGTAVSAFRFAYENSTNAEMKAANGKQLYQAQVLNNDSEGAQATLNTIATEIGPAGLKALGEFCIQPARDFAALNEVIEVAKDNLDEAGLALFDVAKLELAAEALAKGDDAALAKLGYVDPE
jgi:murein DD-endopeptidase MepM/ murein hydrolase activator NlpD